MIESGRKISLFSKVKNLFESVEEKCGHKLYLESIEFYHIIWPIMNCSPDPILKSIRHCVMRKNKSWEEGWKIKEEEQSNVEPSANPIMRADWYLRKLLMNTRKRALRARERTDTCWILLDTPEVAEISQSAIERKLIGKMLKMCL